MILWLVGQTVRRAPRRLILGALGVAFPVAMLAATLLFLDRAVSSMTQIALGPVQVEQRALATSLDVNMTKVGKQLAAIPGVSHVDRFAAANVVVNAPGAPGGATARLFAVDPVYLKHHPWVRAIGGSLNQGALLGQSLRDYSPAFAKARKVSISLPGGGGSLSLPASGTADLRQALPTWFAIPAGDVQGDVALVPRAIVIPYRTFEAKLLPAIRAKLGPTTPVLNPSLTDLPPVSLEDHISVDHGAYPSDPGAASVWSDALRHVLERTPTPGSIVVSDNAFEPLTEASADATNAKILFVLLGIPGALVAAALGLAAQSALAEAQRREDGLLRLRGATEAQLARLAGLTALIAGFTGSAIGVVAALAAVSAVEGQLAWQNISGSSLVVALLAAIAVGTATTGVRLFRLMRASKRSEVVAERRVLERGWRPLWLRAYLDLAAIGIGVTILVVNIAAGGLRLNPIEAAQGTTLALSFYVLLAPIALWIGLTLFAVRVLLAASRRWTRPDRARPLSSWREAALRWLGRRPARTGVALVLGVLAVSFGTEVVTFVSTYGTAKHADAASAFGSDVRLTPGDPLNNLPHSLGPGVSAVTPIREVPARSGTDRKTIMAIDLASYTKTATSAPQIVSGSGIDGLAQDPSGVLVAQEIATDFAVGPGDNLPLTIFPDDQDLSRNINLHVVGVFRSFPPSNPYAEMVMSTAGLPAYSAPLSDFYMVRDAPGHSPASVASELAANPALHKKFAVQTLAGQILSAPRSLASLNLDGLERIEAIGAGLIAAIGVAVLGAFLVLERRREFAVLQAVGADSSQVITGPAQEGIVAVLGSLAIGLPLGLALGVVSVRVLGLFFTLPPPVLTIPVVPLIAFVLLMLVTSAIGLGSALLSVTRLRAASVLREP
jgi:putative ABC transport system permease protein